MTQSFIFIQVVLYNTSYHEYKDREPRYGVNHYYSNNWSIDWPFHFSSFLPLLLSCAIWLDIFGCVLSSSRAFRSGISFLIQKRILFLATCLSFPTQKYFNHFQYNMRPLIKFFNSKNWKYIVILACSRNGTLAYLFLWARKTIFACWLSLLKSSLFETKRQANWQFDKVVIFS